MLGAPLDTVTLLHQAIAPIPDKRTVTFEIRVATPAGVERRTHTDIDTSRGARTRTSASGSPATSSP